MNKKKLSIFMIFILLVAAMLWTTSALADGGGFPTATPTVTSSPAPTNTAQPTSTTDSLASSTESTEGLNQFLQELDQVDGSGTGETGNIDAAPMSEAQDETGQRNWLAIVLIGFTVLFVAAILVSVFIFYQRSRAGVSVQ